jgi:3-deoxy-manno-octulosonate cytidylyltransferase (CMP-KDO synthetase)
MSWGGGVYFRGRCGLRAVGVIPARYASTRFPGKPLASLLGRPMVEWVYRRARMVRGLERVLVATDDARIAKVVRAFGGEAVMTPSVCPSGTDRVWHAVKGLDCDIVLNLQGDEPALDPSGVESLLGLMVSDPELLMGTAVAPWADEVDLSNPNVVKAVLAPDGTCLYFSRSPIPFFRERVQGAHPWRHIGLYAYRKDFLERFTSWEPTPLERAECLEQLRALEHGARIRAVVAPVPACAVDVPEDVPRAEEALRRLMRKG